MVGLLSVEWGAASARRRDVVIGGLAGIVLAGSLDAPWHRSWSWRARSAGSTRPIRSMPRRPTPPSTRSDGRWPTGSAAHPAAAILILFGLAALAPACYSSYVFIAETLRAVAANPPGRLDVDRLLAGLRPDRDELARSARGRSTTSWGSCSRRRSVRWRGTTCSQRGRWAGVRRGVHPPGLIAWGLRGIGAVDPGSPRTAGAPAPSRRCWRRRSAGSWSAASRPTASWSGSGCETAVDSDRDLPDGVGRDPGGGSARLVDRPDCRTHSRRDSRHRGVEAKSMSEAPSETRSHDPVRIRTFAALGHPGFRRFFVGQGISLIGTWLQAAAVRWLVFEQTHSEFMLGVVEVASLMPGPAGRAVRGCPGRPGRSAQDDRADGMRPDGAGLRCWPSWSGSGRSRSGRWP